MFFLISRPLLSCLSWRNYWNTKPNLQPARCLRRRSQNLWCWSSCPPGNSPNRSTLKRGILPKVCWSRHFFGTDKLDYDVTGSKLAVRRLYGGTDVRFMAEALGDRCHLLVATPCRLVQMVLDGRVSLAKVRHLVLDEADLMLDMGFEDQVRYLVDECHMPDKVSVCFSTPPKPYVFVANVWTFGIELCIWNYFITY